MTGVVRRFPLVDLSTEFRLTMPAGAKVLGIFVEESVAISGSGTEVIYSPYLWALVDPEAGSLPRSFVLAPTGATVEVPEKARFVGSFTPGAAKELHLWDLGDGT